MQSPPTIVNATRPHAAATPDDTAGTVDCDMMPSGWAEIPLRERVRTVSRLRHVLAQHPERFTAALAALPCRRDEAESLSAEVLPLAEACAWLRRAAERVLRPRNFGRWFFRGGTSGGGRAAWLWGVRTTVLREPVGRVLVIGPGNFPLFLPGVQVAQALAAGNDVVVKPAPGGRAVMLVLAEALYELGVPRGALRVLGEDVSEGQAWLARVDKVILTGSESTGAAVAARVAAHGKPGATCVLELSGCDAVVVLPGSDPKLTARCIAFGLTLNNGATCIAPRKVYVEASLHAALVAELVTLLGDAPPVEVTPRTQALLRELIDDALGGGAVLRAGSKVVGESVRPLLLTGLSPTARMLDCDVFAPLLGVLPFATVDEAVDRINRCGYRLGASVFGPPEVAHEVAGRLGVGCVVVNDVVVPSADARVPFAPRGRSGRGCTRGAEGLLEMTRIKAIATRHGGARPHLRGTDRHTAPMLRALLAFTYAPRLVERLSAGVSLLKLFRSQTRDLRSQRREAGHAPRDQEASP